MKIVCPHCKHCFEQKPNDIFCPHCKEIADPDVYLKKTLNQMFSPETETRRGSSSGRSDADSRIFSWKKK